MGNLRQKWQNKHTAHHFEHMTSNPPGHPSLGFPRSETPEPTYRVQKEYHDMYLWKCSIIQVQNDLSGLFRSSSEDYLCTAQENKAATNPMWLVLSEISSSLRTWVDSCTRFLNCGEGITEIRWLTDRQSFTSHRDSKWSFHLGFLGRWVSAVIWVKEKWEYMEVR